MPSAATRALPVTAGSSAPVDAIDEERGDASGAHLEALEVMAQVNAVGSEAVARGVEQHLDAGRRGAIENCGHAYPAASPRGSPQMRCPRFV